MGTDIHLIVEQKKNDKWERIDPPENFPRDPWILNKIANIKEEQRNDPEEMYDYYVEKLNSWYSERNYNLFAILANVRNSNRYIRVRMMKNNKNCAVEITLNGYNPIIKPRFLPNDCSCCSTWEGNSHDGRESFNFGEHSFSWLTLKELLDYDWTQTKRDYGVISWEDYKNRKANGLTNKPEIYTKSTQVLGLLYEEGEVPETEPAENENRYVLIWWNQTCAEAAGGFYKNLIPFLKTIDSNPENIRIVFGFDS